MSFILDALKKSESDRQRQSGPSLFEVKVAPPRRALPIWAVAIAVLLGINAIVISWMLLRRGPTQQPAAETRAAAAADSTSGTNAAAAAGPNAASGRAPAELARPPGATLGAAAAGGTAASAPLASPAGASPADQSAGAPPSSPEAPPAESADQSAGAAVSSDGNPSDYAPAVEPSAARGSGAAAGETADLPLYQQIVGSAGLPALHLDLHVFAARPKDRFVMINMQRAGEGDTLQNGVQVEAIRPDGVVLSYHGTRFLLPRN